MNPSLWCTVSAAGLQTSVHAHFVVYEPPQNHHAFHGGLCSSLEGFVGQTCWLPRQGGPFKAVPPLGQDTHWDHPLWQHNTSELSRHLSAFWPHLQTIPQWQSFANHAIWWTSQTTSCFSKLKSLWWFKVCGVSQTTINQHFLVHVLPNL